MGSFNTSTSCRTHQSGSTTHQSHRGRLEIYGAVGSADKLQIMSYVQLPGLNYINSIKNTLDFVIDVDHYVNCIEQLHMFNFNTIYNLDQVMKL